MQTPEFTDSKYTSTLPVTQGKLTVTSLLYFITTQSLISTTTSTMTSATTPHITQILSPSQKQTYSYYNQPILSTTSTQISVRSSYSFILSTDSSGLHLTSSPAVMTSIMPSSKISEYSNTTKAKHNLEVHLSGNTSKVSVSGNLSVHQFNTLFNG